MQHPIHKIKTPKEQLSRCPCYATFLTKETMDKNHAMAVYINHIGTAVPKHKIAQNHILNFMIQEHQLNEQEARELKILYRASGIQYRHSVIPDYGFTHRPEFQFYPHASNTSNPSVGTRMRLYEKTALPLSLEAVQAALPEEFDKNTITHVITVSCTGMYAPGLDIDLVRMLELPTSTQRTAINFMGCYAAFNALKAGYHIINTTPNANVLIVSVELCTLHFQEQKTPDNLLANALFADGASALLMSNQPTSNALKIKTFYNDLAFQGLDEMAWRINDKGFEMKLTSMVPEIIRSGIKELADRLLKHLKIEVADVNYFAIHPGGKRILRVIEQELNLTRTDNRFAYEVLRNYGNMSSATVLFVMKRLVEELNPTDEGKLILSFAFGPGLTMESMLLEVT